MINSIKSSVSRTVANATGWKTNRKIVVIESDDWGSIRMPNKEIYHKLLNKGIRVDLCPYNKYDTLANMQDFDALFNILIKHSDFKNNHPIITMNTNVVNPDFDKIEQVKWEKYHFENFTETLKTYYPKENVFSMWREGIDRKFIFPQFHGREHLNTTIWLDLIRKGNIPLKEAFKLKLYGLSFITSNLIQVPFLASLIYNSDKEKILVEKSILEGTRIFEDIFTFRSKSFIAPLYTWSLNLEPTLFSTGIKYLQGSNNHKDYKFSDKKFDRIHHRMGSKSKYGLIYLHRNCTFEPSILSRHNNIESCLNHIKNAFFWKRPAVITMHRLNFIGSLEEKNRTQNLKYLDSLLFEIRKRWKNVEFMNSSDLGDLISDNLNDDL